MFTKLSFKNTQARFEHPDVVRSWVASACDGRLIDPAIFCRDDKGHTISNQFYQISQIPRILFGTRPLQTGGMTLSFTGIGKEGARILDQSVHLLSVALEGIGFEDPVRTHGTMNIGVSDDFCLYRISRLVVNKKTMLPQQWKRYCGKLTGYQETQDEARSIIWRDLVGAARTLDIELGTNMESQVPNEQDIHVMAGDGVPVTLKGTRRAAAFKNVVIAMPVSLTGPWAVGRLRSRGYGMLERFSVHAD